MIKKISKTLLGSLLTFGLVFTATLPAQADDTTGEELLEDQKYTGGTCQMSTFMQESAGATYSSLINRIDTHGMAPTSLTGLYPAGLMYLRDASAQVIAMIEAGDTARAMPLIRYMLQYSLASGFTRTDSSGTKRQTFPHRIPAIQNTMAKRQNTVSGIAFTSNSQDILVGSLPVNQLGTKQVTRIEIPLKTSTAMSGDFTLRVFSGDDIPMQIATTNTSLNSTTKWVNFDLPPPGYAAKDAPNELIVVLTKSNVSRARIDAAVADFMTPAVLPGAAKQGFNVSPGTVAEDELFADTGAEADTGADAGTGEDTDTEAVTDESFDTDETVNTDEGVDSRAESADSDANNSDSNNSDTNSSDANNGYLEGESTEGEPAEDDLVDEESADQGDDTADLNSNAADETLDGANSDDPLSDEQENDELETAQPGITAFSRSAAANGAVGKISWMGQGDSKPGFRVYTDNRKFQVNLPDDKEKLNGNDDHKLGNPLTWDEMDENMHVFLAWAMYVQASKDVEFFEDTWPAVSTFLELYLTEKVYWLNPAGSTENLMRNPRLDAVEYHDGVYDLVTNVFASAVFESFHKISTSSQFKNKMPNASETGQTWSSLNKAINAGINKHLVQNVQGKNVYVPWLKPDGKTPDLTVGSIWVTLVPNAIDWNGFNATVMRNTIDRYHAENSFNFGGVQMLNARYSEDAKPTVGTHKKYSGQWILLKSLSWEYKFETERKNNNRLKEIALWVGNYFPNTQEPAPESWIVNNPALVPVRDGGNQEHSSWYVSSVLKAYPGCSNVVLKNAGSYEAPEKINEYNPIASERFWGSDRTQTSTEAALGVYGGKKPASVYLARGDNYVDAISGGALNDGPIILLAPGGRLNSDITSALKKLKPARVVALGGTGVISNAVLDQAAKAGGSKKKRFSGSDRFGTAAAIAEESFAQSRRAGKPHTTLYLADGMGPGNTGSPDAVSAGGLNDGATILVNPKSKTLPASTKAVIAKLKPDYVIALGGPTIVNNSVLNEAVKAAGAGTKKDRLYGQDRYETSVEISKHAVTYHAREIILVRGDELADSVTAGGVGRGPILLTPSNVAPKLVEQEIQRIRPWRINVLGGEAVLRKNVVNQLALKAVQPG